MTDRVRQYTVDEFDAFAVLPENLERKLQLINGEIVEEMPKFAHARISVRLILWLGKYFEQHLIGEVFTELRIDLPDAQFDARVPDISVVIDRKAELAKLDTNDALPFMPDLIIEIQSDGQSDRYMIDLANYYFANGCKLVWLIYPDRELVEWLTPTERHLLKVDGVISGGDVLPEFSMPISKLFAS